MDKIHLIDRIKKENEIFIEDSNIFNEYTHTNYLEYLKLCWSKHLGVVVKPDYIWHILLSELCQIIHADKEKYKSLFTEKDEKQDIIVFSKSLTAMPINVLVKALSEKTPIDSNLFLKQFSTSTYFSELAFSASFCDMASPWYKYSMFLCDYDSIRIDGTKEDYDNLIKYWTDVTKILGIDAKYNDTVTQILRDISNNMYNIKWWEEFLKFEECGSGSDVELKGDIIKLYNNIPRLLYPQNFTTAISNVSYKQLDTDKNYRMAVGLLSSKMTDKILEPEFGFIVYEITNEDVKAEAKIDNNTDHIPEIDMKIHVIEVKAKTKTVKWKDILKFEELY